MVFFEIFKNVENIMNSAIDRIEDLESEFKSITLRVEGESIYDDVYKEAVVYCSDKSGRDKFFFMYTLSRLLFGVMFKKSYEDVEARALSLYRSGSVISVINKYDLEKGLNKELEDLGRHIDQIALNPEKWIPVFNKKIEVLTDKVHKIMNENGWHKNIEGWTKYT